jgi:hypothetical protein
VLTAFVFAVIWLHTGRTLLKSLLLSFALLASLVVLTLAAATLRPSWDLSENRRNSFPAADEAALRQIQDPLRITVVLAPEDPRLTDFEQNVLKKLRRNLAHLEVNYTAGSQTGLFEGSEDHYGEIWYEMRGERIMDRSTIEEVVLEQIYKLAKINPPAVHQTDETAGYPLAARPKWAAGVFYYSWPLAIILGWWFIRRERN